MKQFIYLFVTLILTFHGTFGGSVSRTRINGGEDATEGEFPYIISIRRIEGFRHICAGVLINPEWVLTSAFCVAEYDRPYTVRISLYMRCCILFSVSFCYVTNLLVPPWD